jgi:ATP/maltotriose-dependent transcriptional regulator MalT
LALLNLERFDEAAAVARRAEELTSADDLATVVTARCVQARCLAQRGDFEGALSMAGWAVEMADASDWLEFQGEARLHQGEILAGLGRHQEAADVARTAVDRFERKGNLTYAALARSLADTRS